MDASSPEQWLDLHGDALWRYAMLQVRDPELAADLVQETMLAALTAQTRRRGDSAERTWLISILRHKIIDCFRRGSRERPAGDPVWFEARANEPDPAFDSQGRWVSPPRKWEIDPESALENETLRQVLEDCVGLLEDRMAQVFLLREVEGLSTDELCKAFGVTATNLGVILYRARMKLRACVEQGGYAPEDA